MTMLWRKKGRWGDKVVGEHFEREKELRVERRKATEQALPALSGKRKKGEERNVPVPYESCITNNLY